MSKNIQIIAIVIVVSLIVAGSAYYFLTTESIPLKDKPLTIGVVEVGHHDIGTWDPVAVEAVLGLVTEHNYNITLVYAEEVFPPTALDVGRTLAQEVDLIYWTTSYLLEQAKQVAEEFPDVPMIIAEVGPVADDFYPPNMAAFETQTMAEQTNFLLGAAAGKMTETNKIGTVVAMNDPNYAGIVGAWLQGAKYVNPDVTLTWAYMGTFSDPPRSMDTTAAMIEEGADIIFNNMDDEAVHQAATNLGVYSEQNWMELSSKYPNTIIAVGDWNMYNYMKEAIDTVLDGTWKDWWATHRTFELNINRGDIAMVYGDMVPTDVVEELRALEDDVRDGSISIVWPSEFPD